MSYDYMRDLKEARGEFKTSNEAEAMLRSLRRAAPLCSGPKSSEYHGNRMRAVETVIEEMKKAGK